MLKFPVATETQSLSWRHWWEILLHCFVVTGIQSMAKQTRRPHVCITVLLGTGHQWEFLKRRIFNSCIFFLYSWPLSIQSACLLQLRSQLCPAWSQGKFCQRTQDVNLLGVGQWWGFVPRVHDLETFMFLSLWDEELWKNKTFSVPEFNNISS